MPTDLPLLMDADEAIKYFHQAQELSDAEIAYIVGILANSGYTNKRIRTTLNISKVYTVTHYKRAGTALSETELQLWHQNPRQITFAHVRAIAKLPQDVREDLLRNLLRTKMTVVELIEYVNKNPDENETADIKTMRIMMEEKLGRPVQLIYNKATGSGKLTLSFFSVDDFMGLAEVLGCNPTD